MRKNTIWGYIIALFLIAVAFNACSDEKRSIEVKNSFIYLDGKYFVMASAEIDYARIPSEYWEHRLQLLAAMGVNTVTVKVPWMLHEPKEGEYDFKGMKDLKKFCEIAQNKDLLVWLHVGPYVGAEWDMGGMPWWLLNVDGVKLRSNQKAFMQRVGRYFTALGKELDGSFLNEGGNIAVVQIEEAQGLSKIDKSYLTALCDSAKSAGLDKVLTFTSSTKNNFMQTAVDNVNFAIEINSDVKAEEHFTGVTKLRYDAPSVCSSRGGEYKTVWGGESAARNWNKVFMRMFELLQRGTSLSLNGIVAGTSFGYTAGASMSEGAYKPYTTSHNSDGFFKLWGGIVKENFEKFRNSLFTYAQEDDKVRPAVEEMTQLSGFPETAVTDFAPLFENLPEPIEAEKPMTMEKLGLGYGTVLYSSMLPSTSEGTKLVVKDVHDYARIYVDGSFVAALDRRNGDCEVLLPAVAAGARLDILVDGMGRVADVKGFKDYKGITDKVELLRTDGSADELTGWKMYLMPSDYKFAISKNFAKSEKSTAPGYYRTSFNKVSEGDFYLYMGNWGKGEVGLNGHSLGRFWNIGPQYTLYVPARWLKEKDNELIIVDWIGPKTPVVKGIDYSFL